TWTSRSTPLWLKSPSTRGQRSPRPQITARPESPSRSAAASPSSRRPPRRYIDPVDFLQTMKGNGAVGSNFGAEPLPFETVAVNLCYQSVILGDEDSFHLTATALEGARDFRYSLMNWRTRSS